MSALSRPSSYHAFGSPLEDGKEDTAPAIAIAAEVVFPPLLGGATTPIPGLAAWISLLRPSLIDSASSRAFMGEVKVNACGSGSFPGCVRTMIFSITFGLVGGSCCRSKKG